MPALWAADYFIYYFISMSPCSRSTQHSQNLKCHLCRISATTLISDNHCRKGKELCHPPGGPPCPSPTWPRRRTVPFAALHWAELPAPSGWRKNSLAKWLGREKTGIYCYSQQTRQFPKHSLSSCINYNHCGELFNNIKIRAQGNTRALPSCLYGNPADSKLYFGTS